MWCCRLIAALSLIFPCARAQNVATASSSSQSSPTWQSSQKQSQPYIVEWYNVNATKNDCNGNEKNMVSDMISASVNGGLQKHGKPQMATWYKEIDTAARRMLRIRDLACSASCKWKCYYQPYLCYGICSGCGRRLGEDEDRELQTTTSLTTSSQSTTSQSTTSQTTTSQTTTSQTTTSNATAALATDLVAACQSTLASLANSSLSSQCKTALLGATCEVSIA